MSIMSRLQLYGLLFLVLLTAGCSGQQRYGRAGRYAHKESVQASVQMIPRGGDIQIIDQVEETLVDIGLKPLIQKHTLLIGKAIISSFFVAQILAYLGFIGDKGEGLYEWAVDNKKEIQSRFRKLGLQPGGFLRVQLEKMLVSFANLPDRAQFVTCVSLGATVFPLVIQTVVVTTKVTLVTFAAAELLARLGVLGEVGEGRLGDYLEDPEPLVRSITRWVDQTRRQLRKKLQLGEVFRSAYQSLRKDRVFWAGLSVGGIAGVVLDNDKVSQGMS